MIPNHDLPQPMPFEPFPDTSPNCFSPQLLFAIIVPDPFLLHLYFRPETGRMRYCAPLLPHQLPERINIMPGIKVVALAGNRAADHVTQALPHRNLFVVPDAWLKHLPPRNLDARARTTARLVHAHLLDPIQLRLAPTEDDIPF